jgi:hypothetical protein
MDADVLQKMISEYRKKVETYKAMIAEWEKELGVTSTSNGSSDSEVHAKPKSATSDIASLVRNFQFYGKTQTDAARALLEMVGHPLTTEEVMEGLTKGGVSIGGKTPRDKKQNFYTILNRSKDFGRAAKNTWGLTSWPGITKESESEETDDSEKKEEVKK